ncbi:MAG: Ppx/GppA family phosphatase [Pseudomonadota bacterium]
MTHYARWPRRAVVDIGSNSVRLVIVSGPPRVPITITNEKVLCGLGDRDEATGALREEAVARALATLKRFKLIIDEEDLSSLDVFATAAVRDAPNGSAFLTSARNVGFDPRLLSGEEEARLAGLGILCSAPEILRSGVPAIGGDLGGGSLELSLLGGVQGDVTETVSLPIGSLRMLTMYKGNLDAVAADVRERFSALQWLSECAATSLYIVGGSWRALARIAMAREGHPVAILDHYTLSADQMYEICRDVETADPETLAKIDGVQKKRVPTLPSAAVVLRHLIEQTKVSRIVVSSCGVREGLLFDRLTEEERQEEPLVALTADMAERCGAGRAPSPAATMAFLAPLFQDDGSIVHLQCAAAQLVRVANTAHPDQRARFAAGLIMASPFLGIDHLERTMLALILLIRYGGSPSKDGRHIPVKILSDRERDLAVKTGFALRLASSLRLPLYKTQSGLRFSSVDEEIVLKAIPEVADLVSESVLKDLDKLAEAFDVVGRVSYEAGV